MAQPVVTRTQRRVERKQLLLIVILILAVAGVSFTLGVKFGQKGGPLPGFDSARPKLPMVTQVVPPPPPATDTSPEKPQQLTFYDNLPKGNQAPLGSGINLPPEEHKPAPAARPKVEESAAAPSQQTLPAEVSAPAPPAVFPPAAAKGDFVVQVASFRTRQDAEKLAGRLKSYKMPTFVEPVDLGKKGTWYRVIAGPYANRDNADRAAAMLREKERLSALVRQR